MSTATQNDRSHPANNPRKAGHAGNALLTAFFIIGGVVVLNLIGTRVFGRIDLTEAKMYTISKGSKDLVKNLPDFLNVKAFISEDLPPELKTVARYVRDSIDEYQQNSGGKLRWEATDPGKDEKKQQAASSCKVEQMQVQVVREGKFEVGAYYLGLCLQYGDKIESIPQISRPEGLEYQMTSLIKKMTAGKRKIAFTSGHGDADSSQGFQGLREALEAEYETTTVNPSSAEIGADIDALIVGGPKQAIDEKGQREIDKFFMRGKGGVILLDGMAMSSPNANGMAGMEQMQIKMGQPNETGLGKLLEAYGFKVNQDFIFEPEANTLGPVSMNGRMMVLNVPVYVVAQTDKHPDLSVLSGLRGAILPYASSVETVGPLKSGAPAGTKLWRLAGSTPQAWRHTGFFVLTPTTKYEPTAERGPFNFGYAFEGKLRSAFGGAAPLGGTPPPAAPSSESSKPVRLVVMGDSDFANDEYTQLARHPLLTSYDAGRALLFNAISWSIEDEILTPLRNKTLSPRPVKTDSETTANALKWGNVLGLPLAFCLFGVIRWRVRRARRTNMKL